MKRDTSNPQAMFNVLQLIPNTLDSFIICIIFYLTATAIRLFFEKIQEYSL